MLFATSIAENIRHGLDGVSQEDIEAAARQANAHDFIQNLPEVSKVAMFRMINDTSYSIYLCQVSKRFDL